MKRDELFNLIHPRADWHLQNWRKWMHRYQVGKGYPHSSAVFETGGLSGEDEFDVMCDSADNQAARVVDGVLDSIARNDPRAYCAICNVYLARVWMFRGDPVEVFKEAADEIWIKIQQKGLA